MKFTSRIFFGTTFLLALFVAVFSACNKNASTTTKETGPVVPKNTKPIGFATYTAGEFYDFSITNLASLLALEIGNTSLANGGTADQNTYSGNSLVTNANQKWKITALGTGYFTIMNLGSGKYLQSPTTAGAQVFQYSDTTTDAQLWSINNVGPGAYSIINKQTGLALTDHGASGSAGAPITAETYANNNSQWWGPAFIPLSAYRDDQVVRFFQRTSGSEAFDGGASVPLTTGQVLWVTNDVFYNQLSAKGEFNCGQIFNYHNSLLGQPAGHSWDPAQTINILSPNGVQIFHDSNSGDLLWPGAGIQIGSHVYVQNIEVPIGSLSADNQFLCDITAAGPKSINAVANLTVPGMSGQTAILYSLGMVNPGDGYVYAYGTGGFIGANVYVARFPLGSPTSWTFWNGSTWAATPTNASAAAIANGPANNNTVGYVNGKYVLITMDFGFSCDETSRNMYSATSTSPTGPFTNKTTVYSLPDMKDGQTPVFYNPTIHAEFVNGQNELLVNYCINFYSKNNGTNAVCLAPCSNADGSEDPNDYRPKGVRIPYSLIGL